MNWGCSILTQLCFVTSLTFWYLNLRSKIWTSSTYTHYKISRQWVNRSFHLYIVQPLLLRQMYDFFYSHLYFSTHLQVWIHFFLFILNFYLFLFTPSSGILITFLHCRWNLGRASSKTITCLYFQRKDRHIMVTLLVALIANFSLGCHTMGFDANVGVAQQVKDCHNLMAHEGVESSSSTFS